MTIDRQPMTVLVTGGAGYIGSHTVRQLQRRGDRVIVLDDLSNGHAAAVGDAHLVVGDIGDAELVARTLSEERVTDVPFAASVGLLALRVVIGAAFMFHGWGKIQHPFSWMPAGAPVPGFLQALAALSEFGGGLAWILGLLTPLASLGIAVTMAVAVAMHVSNGDPFFAMGGPAYESAAVYLGIRAVVAQSFARKLIDIDYHIAMGGRAYGTLAGTLARGPSRVLGQVFAELAEKFQPLVDALNEVSETSHSHTDEDILRLYEIWLKTGSRRSYRILRQLGVDPTAAARSPVTQH